LTDAGEQLLPDLTSSFELITRAIRQVSVSDKELKIIAAPTMAIRWLIPYLQQYQDEYPDIRVSTSWFKSSYDEFFDGGFDIGFDCESSSVTRPEGLESMFLISESLTPVCSPEYLKAAGPINDLRDMSGFTLIHSTPDQWDWRMWCQHIGIDKSQADQGRVFDTSEMAISAAINGMGIAIADLNFIQAELKDGRLVAPLDIVVREGTGYYLFTKRGRLQERKLKTFVNWILKKTRLEEEGNN